MGALAFRAYQSFGIGNTALLAVAAALLGIWGVPRIFEHIRPRKPTLKEIIASLLAGLLVLFVWTANTIPILFQETEPEITTAPSSTQAKEDFEILSV
jgi:RsiW-degrading membrane proteinase PrsW (M82 family)